MQTEIEDLLGGTKVIKSVCITLDNTRLSPLPLLAHPQIQNTKGEIQNVKKE